MVVNSMNLAVDVGSSRATMLASGIPIHGITIDHPSTNRCRYTFSTGVNPAMKSS
jgi:hypothetical protein